MYIEIETKPGTFIGRPNFRKLSGIETAQKRLSVETVVCAKCRLVRSNLDADGVCGFCTSVAVREVKESLWRKVVARLFK